MDRDSLHLLLAQGLSVEKIAQRFGKHPSTVAYWMAKHGLEAPHREAHLARGGVERDRLAALVDAGLSIRQIAQEVDRSNTTVRHWLRRHGLQTRRAAERRPVEEAQAARDAGLLSPVMRCRVHGDTEFVLEGRGYYRCKRCRADRVSERRRELKTILVREAGGRCVICGYDRSSRALEFHHLDPATKRLHVSGDGVTLALAVLRAEAQKCVLLCSNCHAEVEAGEARVPLKFAREAGDHPGGGTGLDTP
jgi:transposase